jgi:hypothetical protein
MVKLADDDAFYAASCARAYSAGEAFKPAQLAPRYVAYFQSILHCAPAGAG